MQWGKWLGAGFGFIVASSPIGRIFGTLAGLGLGSLVDKLRDEGFMLSESGSSSDTNDFVVSMLVLAGKVVKADGNISDDELGYIRTYLADQFGPEEIGDYMYILNGVLEQEYSLANVCSQIRSNTSYETRLQLLHFLFGIADADFHITEGEVNVIRTIGMQLGIKQLDFESIQAMFKSPLEPQFKILELRLNATNDEVKRAYREMAIKYHPDKVAHLGESVQKAAQAKFQKVQEAYDLIKKHRSSL